MIPSQFGEARVTIWADEWDIGREGQGDEWHALLEVVESTDPAHAFVAELTVSTWAAKAGTTGDLHDDWETVNPRLVHRSEHGSVEFAVRALKRAARRAEALRVGPEHD